MVQSIKKKIINQNINNNNKIDTFIFDSFFNGALWDRSQIPVIAVLLLVLLILLLLLLVVVVVVVVLVIGWYIQERIKIKK